MKFLLFIFIKYCSYYNFNNSHEVTIFVVNSGITHGKNPYDDIRSDFIFFSVHLKIQDDDLKLAIIILVATKNLTNHIANCRDWLNNSL